MVFTIQLLVGVMLFSMMYLLAFWVGDWFSNPLYVTLMQVSVLTFLWRPFANLPTVRLRRKMHFKQIAIIRLLTLLFGSIMSIVLALNEMGPWSLVLSGIGSSLFNISVLNLIVRHPFKIHFDITIAKRFGSYGFRFVTVDALEYAFNQTSNFIIGRNADAASVGLFNKADSMSKIPVIAIGGSVYQPIFRALSQEQDNDDKTWYLYQQTISLLSIYMLPFHVFLFWLAAPLIEFIYGSNWIAAAEPMQILAATGFFLSFGQPSGAVLAARNQLHREVWVQASACVLLVVLASAGIHYLGLIGVAFAVTLAEAYRSTALVLVTTRVLNIGMLKVFLSMKTGIALNGILFMALFGMDIALADNIRETAPVAYLITMIAAGSIFYLLAFFYLPLPELRSESSRWRAKISALIQRPRHG